jgi:hypothetical protein
LIINTLTGSYKFIVTGDYYLDEETEYDENAFYLLPKTAINGQDIVYHFEFNSVKLGNRKHQLKKL